MADRSYGKYRGVVIGNRDPERRLRLQVQVPDVLEDAVAWAIPCVPFGFEAVPPVGAGVWVEFEAGDVERPIWSGTWWVAEDVPPTA
jgi:hypothetical protein